MRLADRLALAEHWLARHLPRVSLRVQAQCVLRGHDYADNGPALREIKPGAVATLAWCGRCVRRLPVRRDEQTQRATRWEHGWEGR